MTGRARGRHRDGRKPGGRAARDTKFVVVGLAIGGRNGLALAILADVGVTVLVILNSLRLLRFERDRE